MAGFTVLLWKVGHSIPAVSQMADKGIWEKLLEILVDEPDFEWLMIDAGHCKVHPHAAGAKGGPDKRGLNTKLHLAVDANGMPVRILITRVPELIVKKLFT